MYSRVQRSIAKKKKKKIKRITKINGRYIAGGRGEVTKSVKIKDRKVEKL
jgi:hypothetical protein